jgi:hypothetical protein
MVLIKNDLSYYSLSSFVTKLRLRNKGRLTIK